MLDVAVDALAVARLVHLVTEDRVAAPLRRYADARSETAGYFARCPWCTGTWLAVGVVCARAVAPRAWAPLARALAFSEVAGLLAER